MTAETDTSLIAPPRTPPSPAPAEGKFTTGSILRHIVVMSAAGAVGLIALFIGDLATIQFLSQLNQVEPVAAVSYASNILFVSTSVGIGVSIAAGAVVSRTIGARDTDGAQRLSGSALVLTAAVALALNLAIWIWATPLLAALGATGKTLTLASTYLRIIAPFQTAMMIGMTASGLLRASGDAKSAMNITVLGAIVTLVLDATLILGLGLGIEGAAWASVMGRIAMMGIGLYLVLGRGAKIRLPRIAEVPGDWAALMAIAVPAVLTNIATPVAAIYVTSAISPYGDEAVAAWGIVNRLVPVAFGALFALSGSVGPIVGQNYGSGRIDRVAETLTKSLWVTAAICGVAWLLLLLSTETIIWGFRARGQTAELVRLFTIWLAPLFVFMGMLFVANAFFNSLKKPHWATMLNWARATIGTIPFVMAGGWLAGAKGVMIANTVGQIAFGVLAVWMARRLVAELSPAAGADVARKPAAKAAGAVA